MGIEFSKIAWQRRSCCPRRTRRQSPVQTDHLFIWHSLKQAISEQNLELLPDYEQRIAVLEELQFIDSKHTVLLKGRVACEVSSR